MFFCEQFVGLCYSCFSQKNSHGIIISLNSFIWFLCFFFSVFHTHICWKLLTFRLRYRLKMSHCNIGNFNFEPLLTLHAPIQTLLRVGIMLHSSSKNIKRVSHDTRKGLQFEFVLICFNSFKWKCYLGLPLKSFTRISSKF